MVQHSEQVEHEYELVEVCQQVIPSVTNTTTSEANKTPCLPPIPKPRPIKRLTVAPPTGRYMGMIKKKEEEESVYCIPEVQ